jgi:hypothetical protein
MQHAESSSNRNLKKRCGRNPAMPQGPPRRGTGSNPNQNDGTKPIRPFLFNKSTIRKPISADDYPSLRPKHMRTPPQPEATVRNTHGENGRELPSARSTQSMRQNAM